jgi:hypothetical protein
LHLIVAPQLISGWQHNYSTKTRQVGQANEQSMYSLMSMVKMPHPMQKRINAFSKSPLALTSENALNFNAFLLAKACF